MSGKFDDVLKAERYNSHPSGIEVKHVVRLLDFNLGCVFKYVARRDHKEGLRSLKSALFYINDRIENMAECPDTNWAQSQKLYDLVKMFAACEPPGTAQQFYLAFTKLVKHQKIFTYHTAVRYWLELLIAEYEAK